MSLHPPEPSPEPRSEHQRDLRDSRETQACTWRDAAWCFVLGSSSAGENRSFQDHLLEGCPACGRELRHARQVIGDLDLTVARRTVQRGQGSSARPEVRELLLESCGTHDKTPFSEQVAESSTSERGLVQTGLAGIALVPDSQTGWVSAGVPGVEMKTLAEDRERRAVTALIRMEPGSSYPSHRHALREECLVLSGDLYFADQRMTAGDYQVAEKGSIHPVQATKGGCTLLVVSSLDDEPHQD